MRRFHDFATRLTMVGALSLGLMACGGDDAARPVPSGNALVPTAADETPSSEGASTSGGSVPVISRVALTPPVLVPGTEVKAIVDASDPDGDVLRYHYKWSYNGKETQTGTQSAFYIVDLAKGDRVEVVVTASDGKNTSEPMSARASAGNRPPVLSAITLEPFGDVRAGETITASPIANDPDNDDLRFTYAWYVNEDKKGRERTFDTKGLRRGDKIQVRVVASDGAADSREKLSPVLMLGNSPPVITQLPSSGAEDGTFKYTFVARDPDGDRNLRFFVEKGPQGLRMDAISGVLTWTPNATQAGVHPIEVGVRDGAGDGSTFTFELTVRASAPAPAARGY